MRAAITNLLLTHGPLTDLVGKRIHWVRRPAAQRTFPYLNLRQISGFNGYVVGGRSDLRRVRIQVDIWAEKFGEVEPIREVLSSLLSGYSGVHKTKQLTVLADGERDLGGDAPEGESPLFGMALDFIVMVRPK